MKPVGNTVDLTHGKTPVPHDSGYASRTYLFSESETDRILDKARALDLSLQQYMCLVIAEAMFSTQPDKSRVCMLVPTDLARYLPDLPRTVPGNYTGTMVVQLRRGAPLHSQIARQFGWLHRGIDYWSTRLVAASSQEQVLNGRDIERPPFRQRHVRPRPLRPRRSVPCCRCCSRGSWSCGRLRGSTSDVRRGRLTPIEPSPEMLWPRVFRGRTALARGVSARRATLTGSGAAARAVRAVAGR